MSQQVAWERILEDESATDQFAKELAAALAPGIVVGLIGDLGSGKTRLVRNCAIALGADPERINSPTFVLIQEYSARIPLFHFDTYRLRSPIDFPDLGPEEYFRPDAICFVEWADRVLEWLPEDLLRIELEILGPQRRRLRLHADGPAARQVLARLRQTDSPGSAAPHGGAK